jgi:exopolysaccharide biosynthesis polyprenyl glycosylphosphotransferase
MTFLTFSSTSYLFKIQISRFVILFSLVGGTILHLILRWTFLRVVDKQLQKNETQEKWLVLSKHSESSLIVQQFADQNKAIIVYSNLPDTNEDFSAWVKEVAFQITLGKYNKLLLASFEGLTPVQIENLMWVIQQTDAEFVVHDDLGLATAQSGVKYFEGFNWLSIGAPQINDSLRVIKRVFDITLVLPTIILLSPVYLIISLGILIDSRGSLIYTQTRVGQNGKLFKFPKFRSMRAGSDSIRLDVLGRPDENMANRYKADPRITRFGRLLRRFSLDELPQLWCVFIGTMSLVGPRPILPEEEVQLGEFHFRRQIAKPGLTGIWQVSGRKDTSWEERMAFDIKYVQEWSMALDLILIARTFKVIVSGKGSY